MPETLSRAPEAPAQTGRRMPDLYVEAPEGDLRASMSTVLSGGISVRVRRIRRKDGTVITVEGRARLLPDGTFLALYREPRTPPDPPFPSG